MKTFTQTELVEAFANAASQSASFADIRVIAETALVVFASLISDAAEANEAYNELVAVMSYWGRTEEGKEILAGRMKELSYRMRAQKALLEQKDNPAPIPTVMGKLGHC